MPSPLARKRMSAYQSQTGRCYYCGVPMCTGDPVEFSRVHGITPRRARLLTCTAEHLCARCDGGGNAASNLVAACLYCNRHRHARPKPLEPAKYRRLVQSRMQRDKWHGAWARKLH